MGIKVNSGFNMGSVVELKLKRGSKVVDYIRRKLSEQMNLCIEGVEEYPEFLIKYHISTWFFKDCGDMCLELLLREWTMLFENYGNAIRKAWKIYDINAFQRGDMLDTVDLIIELLSDLEDLESEGIQVEVY